MKVIRFIVEVAVIAWGNLLLSITRSDVFTKEDADLLGLNDKARLT